MEKVFAQICNPALPAGLGGCGSGSGQQGGKVVGNLISGIISMLLIFGFFLTLFYFLTGGIQWITSQGDKNALEGARNKITHSIIGLIIVASTYAVFKLVGNFLGITLPNIKIPTITGQ